MPMEKMILYVHFHMYVNDRNAMTGQVKGRYATESEATAETFAPLTPLKPTLSSQLTADRLLCDKEYK